MRGKRSQTWVNRRLGCKSNVVYTWERGRNFPSVTQFLELLEICGQDTRAKLRAFSPKVSLWLQDSSRSPTTASVSAFLRDQRGQIPIGELAASMGVSRFCVSRWLKGTAQPKLPELLSFVHHSSKRLLEFVELFADVGAIPELGGELARHQAATQAAKEVPWSQAVLRAIEAVPHDRFDSSVEEVIAQRLRIDVQDVARSMKLLAASGQIAITGGRWVPIDSDATDLGRDRSIAETQRRFWSQVAAERVGYGKGMCAYNICGVSAEDLLRLKQLQRDYLRQARAIIAESKPVEHVALLITHVLALDEFHDKAE